MKISKTTIVEHFDYKAFKPNSLYYIEFFNGEMTWREAIDSLVQKYRKD